jgi:hypothetical protein
MLEDMVDINLVDGDLCLNMWDISDNPL